MKIEVVTAAMLCVGTGLLSGMLTARCIRRTKKEPELERLEVPVPEGKLIAYSSGGSGLSGHPCGAEKEWYSLCVKSCHSGI